MRDLLAALGELRERLKEIPQADERRLQDLKTEILGRKAGTLTQILGALPRLDPASKKEVGASANALKREFETAFAARERALKHAAGVVTGLDLTMPGRAAWRAGLHLVTQVVDEICDIFRELGFTRAVGPEVENERYNFFALNFPWDHPALDAQDSFYVGPDLLLRTHTSPVQIRTLELPAAHPRRHSGAGVPARSVRRLALARVRADRGPGRGRGDQLRRFQGHPRHLRAPLLHRRYAGA